MITQVCNLSCQGCTNYSDLKHSGYVTWQQGKAWLDSWLQRVDIPDFGIMGGEPMINPEWMQWVEGVRELMPDSQIRFTTNGLLIKDYQQMLDFFEHVGNVVFKISVHVNDSRLEQTIQNIQQAKPWQQVEEYGIVRWKTTNNLRFQINRPTWFFKTYRGDYNHMRPHHNLPDLAFESCVQKTCPLLFEGRIYKCSTSALTQSVLKRFNNPYQEEWKPYLDLGLLPTCNNSDLEKFIENFGRPNAICAQCPTVQDIDSKLNHTTTVVFK